MVSKLSTILLFAYGRTIVMVFYNALIMNEWTDSKLFKMCRWDSYLKQRKESTLQQFK